MSNDHIQRQMDFIVRQQAKFSVDIEEMKEFEKRLAATVERMAKEAEIDRRKTNEAITHLNNVVNDLSNTVNSIAIEMREGFNNLIIANESTRELASQAAKLAIQTGERMNRLEDRLGS